MVEGRDAIRDAAYATQASHPCAVPSTSGDCAIRRYPFTKRLSPRSKAPPAGGWLWVGIGAAGAIVVSAATGSLVTFAAMHNATQSAAQPSSAPPASPSAPTTPQISAASALAAKDHLCQVFDTSVRGQEGQGGLRVQGNLNLPVALRALNSASAVQNALVPSVPPGRLPLQQGNTSAPPWTRRRRPWETRLRQM